MKINLPNDVLFISDLYKKSGKEIYVVGGAVRDSIRGIVPKDFDLATNATPDETIAILKPYFAVKEVGKSFGVVIAVTKEFPDGIEIATFRADEGTGRRPKSVRFTSIEEDVLRRDLTINALFYNIDKQEIVDLVGGKKDLEAGIIRTVGNPEDIFSDDPLRRIRAIRFHGDLDGTLSEDLYVSLANNSDLSEVSRDRIMDEFDKLLKRSKNIHKSLALLKELGMLHQLFPDLKIEIDLVAKDPTVTIALMLRNNIDEISDEVIYPMPRLQNQLNYCKYTVVEIAIISYLIRLKDLSLHNAYNLKKAERRCKVRKEQIKEFLSALDIPKYIIEAYLQYEITTVPQDLMNKGFLGVSLGVEIERLETILFFKILTQN